MMGSWQNCRKRQKHLSPWQHPGLVKYSGSCRLRSGVLLLLKYRQSLRCISCCPSFLPGFFSWACTPERNQRILSHVNLVRALLVGVFLLFFLNLLLLTCFSHWKLVFCVWEIVFAFYPVCLTIFHLQCLDNLHLMSLLVWLDLNLPSC